MHPPGGLFHRQFSDLGENGTGVLVPGPQALEVEHTHAAQTADFDGGCRADHAVHGRHHERQFEPVGVDLPGDVYVLRVTCTAARDDGDVVEPVSPPSALAHPDLNFGHGYSLPTPIDSARMGLGAKPRKGSILVTCDPTRRKTPTIISGPTAGYRSGQFVKEVG